MGWLKRERKINQQKNNTNTTINITTQYKITKSYHIPTNIVTNITNSSQRVGQQTLKYMCIGDSWFYLRIDVLHVLFCFHTSTLPLISRSISHSSFLPRFSPTHKHTAWELHRNSLLECRDHIGWGIYIWCSLKWSKLCEGHFVFWWRSWWWCLWWGWLSNNNKKNDEHTKQN